MRELLICTRSKGKFPEIVKKLKGLPFDFLNLNDVEEVPRGFEVDETEETFKGNAILKARTLGEMTGILTLADDSGLEVDALGGKPGVYSARYAPGTDKDRYEKLLNELEGAPDKERTARFKCVVAIFDPKSKIVKTCTGVCEGMIVFSPKGSFGFGYDPVFLNPSLGKTNAELTAEEKNKISHRGKALEKARKLLKDFTSLDF
jgi:XTP/dITP diphosphohydrolase